MSKSYRIRTKPGQDNGYLKVDVDLNQNYDFLELLSLKISQNEEYQSFCSDYGVVAGRVIVNDGFGVPNVKVSIFVPVDEADLDNPVKSAIYNYTQPFSDQKNENGIRYNLLPQNQQSLDHTPVGTFPKKREVLDDRTTLEIYEKYYKYTTTTNESGDYIIFGVPVGQQFLHYDMDVSDIGFLSTRPYELINQGYGEDLFNNRYKFKSSNNLDSLPQIFSGNIPITVEPYWCDSLSVGSALGINRLDIEPDVQLNPTSVFMGSVFTDDEKDSLNKNCKPAREMGKMNEVITGAGKIEAIRRTVNGSIEKFDLKEDSIDENGNWSVLLPMNIRKVVTDEFGNLIPSPDGIKGVSTEGDYRFRISMDATSNDKRLRQRAKFLVPNTNNNFNFKEYSQNELRNSTDFTLNEQISDVTDNTDYSDDITNQYNYLEEFYPFRWKKIYTVKQYIGRLQKLKSDEARGFIGIKDIINAEGVNKFPSNRHDTNFNILYTIICVILSLFATVIGIINGIINIINGLITTLCNLKIPFGFCVFSSDKGSRYRLDYERQKYNSFVNDFVNNGTLETDFTEEYAPLPDFTGGPGTPGTPTKDPGDWDGALGNCNTILGVDGAKDWYPSDIDPNTGTEKPLNPSYASTDYADILRFPNIPWEDIIDGNGNSVNQWLYVQETSQGNYVGNPACETSPFSGCYRVKLKETGSWRNSIDNCQKRDINDDEDCGIKFLGIRLCFRYFCLFGRFFCKKCGGSCQGDNSHSCCPDNYEYGCENGSGSLCGGGFFGAPSCCSDCCVKIPLIPLRCAETGEQFRITLIPTPFGARLCNKVYVVPLTCKSCGGLQTPGIKDWLSCVLEGLAVSLRMLKFDFYNDWVGGSLYFPLIKRKYKLKKSKRKFGQIKKDKFCDYECKIRGEDEFQGEETFEWRIKIPSLLFSNPTLEVNGCTAKIKGRRVSDWYGSIENQNEAENLELAVKDITFPGTDTNNEPCNIEFATYSGSTGLNQVLSDIGINVVVKEREIPGEHGKPEYISTEDASGFSTWKNVGGHGHHRNICDNTRMLERKEYFKEELDCGDGEVDEGDLPENNEILGGEDGFETPVSEDAEYDSEGNVEDSDDDPTSNVGIFCPQNSCGSKCGFNGVAPCRSFAGKQDFDNYRGQVIKHGLITWEEGEIYYTPYIPNGNPRENTDEYKGNLLLPTTIMELGSMTFCDIDNVPYVINQVRPTTFNVSYEDYKTKIDGSANTYLGGDLKKINKFGDRKDSSLNLSAYIEFSCYSVVCANISGIVNQSQIGVDIIDKNDIGVEAGTCFLRFDHDTELRDYFCRRFNGYKSDRTFHHQRPNGNDTDNIYNTYPEVTLVDASGTDIYYELPDDEGSDIILSEYNDSDPFTPGDACGYRDENNNPDYFYGLAPGSTQNFINYPNGSQTINFGGTEFTEEVTAENVNPNVVNVSGIRFNRSQTPYHLYFGLVPGKTALHKTVGKFFADKINAITLEGVGASNNDVEQTINNTPGINGGEKNSNTVYKTCLGDTLITTVEP